MIYLRKSDGITLIALVITIIVLLMLSGITISMLNGENGILTQVVNAKIETDRAQLEETIKLAIIESMTGTEYEITKLQQILDKYLGKGKVEATKTNGGYTVTAGEIEYVVDSNGEIGKIEEIANVSSVVNKNTTVIDAKGEKFVLPANFKLSKNEDGSLIEDEITKGIVIEDSKENQYVWIPIFEKTEDRTWGADYSAVASETDYTDIQKALKNYTKTYSKGMYLDSWYKGEYGYYKQNDTEQTELIPYTNGNMTEVEYNTLYNNMLKSIYKNGGFYIGRYEMGTAAVNSIEEAQANTRRESSKKYKSSDNNATNEAPTIEGMTTPVSKANAVPYNFITQAQAQMLAEKLGEQSDYSNITSSIMFGIQWDIVCVFIEKYDNNEEKLKLEDQTQWLNTNIYSKLWGNYNGSSFSLNRGYYSLNHVEWIEDYISVKEADKKWLCTTGASDQNMSLNIYDFAGGISEYTLEMYKYSGPGVGRSGGFYDGNWASARQICKTYASTTYYTSRYSLCIK